MRRVLGAAIVLSLVGCSGNKQAVRPETPGEKADARPAPIEKADNRPQWLKSGDFLTDSPGSFFDVQKHNDIK